MIHVFSDSQRGINPELLPLLDFSSNCAAAIPTACCTEAIRRTRDVLTNNMLRKRPFRLYVTHFDRHVMTGGYKATICRDHHAGTRKAAEVSLIFDRNVIAGDIRHQSKPGYCIPAGLLHKSPTIVGFGALQGSPILRPGPSVK
jgi:hypothetical protein